MSRSKRRELAEARAVGAVYSAEFVESVVRNAVIEALLEAADVMPIETLLGADKASVWLRDYADRWGKQ